MSDVCHVMVDIETTGTDPELTNIIQIGAVTFDPKPEGPEATTHRFQRSLLPAQGRFWSEGTRDFWYEREDLLKKIQIAAEHPQIAMDDLARWVRMASAGRPVFFWAKPITFDFAFVESYYRQFEMKSPFNFRQTVDVRSFIRAKLNTFDASQIVDFEQSVRFVGTQHDAMADALHQIALVKKAQELALV